MARRKRLHKLGYLYILESDGMTKIGISKNNPEYRVKQLSTGNPNPIRLVRWYQREDYKELEKYLHRLYAPLQTNGGTEWFNVDPSVVITTIEGKDFIMQMIGYVWSIILWITVLVIGSFLVYAYLTSIGIL